MTSRLTFRRNFAWNFAGTSLYNAAQWLLIVGLTHLSAPDVVGHFSLMLAISAPIFLTVGMNLRSAQATDVTDAFTLTDYISLRLVLNTIATIVTVLAGLALGFWGIELLALAILAVAKSIEATSQSFYGFFQRHERLDLVSRSLIARSVCGPLAFLSGFTITDSLVGATLGLLIGWSSVQIVLDRRLAHQLADSKQQLVHANRRFSDRRTLARLARTCAPLGVDAGLSSLTINIPRYALQLILGAAQLAMFAALAYLAQVVSMVTFTMGTVIVPRLAMHHYRGRREAFVRLLLMLTGFGLFVSAIAIVGARVFGDFALSLILSPEYVNNDLLTVLMISAGFTTLQRSLCKGLVAARRFTAYMAIDAITAAATLACAIPMVYAWGVLGAAWSLAGGFMVGSIAVLVPLADVLRKMPKEAPA